MGLTSCQSVSSLIWGLNNTTNVNFNPSTQSGSTNFNLGNIDLTIWNQFYSNIITLLPTANSTIDLSSFTNACNEDVSFTSVLSIFILPVRANIYYQPGASNGLVWFLNDVSDVVSVEDGGTFLYSGSKNSAGAVIDSTHKTLKFTNTASISTPWSSITSYSIGDKSSVAGTNYICIKANTNNTPPNTTYWSVVDTTNIGIYIIGSTL